MGYHIDELNIEAFRGLRNVRLSQLGRINLLVGENNSGKTSVLEALVSFCDPLWVGSLVNAVGMREIFDLGAQYFHTLEWLFPHSPRKPRRSSELFEGRNVIRGSGTFLVQRVQIDYQRRTRFRERADAPSEQFGADLDFSVEIAGQGSRIANRVEVWDDSPIAMGGPQRQLRLPLSIISTFGHHQTYLLVKDLSREAIQNAKKPILDLLRQLDDDITDLQMWAPSGREPALYIEHRETGVTPVSAFGDGIVRALRIAVGFPYAGVLLIDEIESSLHASALSTVFRWLVKTCEQENVQLFATTHSLEALDTLLDEDVSGNADLVGYRLERDGTEIHAERFGRDALQRLRYERGLDVRL
jgi:hypothetical protein